MALGVNGEELTTKNRLVLRRPRLAGEYNRSAWLKAEEVADIVNAILLAKADGGSQDHLYQPDKPHPYGGEVWDQERVKSELRQKGIAPFNRIDNASVNGVDWGVGKTTSISFSGDGGSVSFSGDEFKII